MRCRGWWEIRGWSRAIKDFELGQEAIQWLWKEAAEDGPKLGRLREGGWLGDQGALLFTSAPARQWHWAWLSCVWSHQIVSAGGRQGCHSNHWNLDLAISLEGLSQGHRAIFSVCSSGREEILRSCMDRQERKVPMVLLVVATVEMLLRMPPLHKTVSTPC